MHKRIIGIKIFSPILNNENKNLFCIKVLPLSFKNHPTIKHKKSVFSGRRMFEDEKSSRSKKDLPAIVKSLRTPKDNVAGIEIKPIIKNNNALALILEMLNLSVRAAAGTSKMLMPEVKAATKRRMKNAAEMIFPKGSWLKIAGRVTKTKPAPESGSSPKDATAGKIIIPARIANIVSAKIIVYADFVMFLSSFI